VQYVRSSSVAASILSAGLLLCLLTWLDAALSDGNATALRARLIGELQLTDLALFTEARYTRHPSQADLHSAFQNHPTALDHFPSGSLRAPPDFRMLRHAPMD